MTRTAEGVVRDARPPEWLVKAANPLVRAVVRSPAGRAVGALAIVDHRGRRTGAARHVVAVWHQLDGREFVVSPAAWRANFTDAAPARVTHRGRRRPMTGRLDADPEQVAATLRACLVAGVSPRSFGLAIGSGHEITADDVTRVHRAIVWFDPPT